MSTGFFILCYVLSCLFWKWILSWGGAEWMEGWKSMLFLNWFVWDWTAEQIRLYAVLIWGIHTVYFVLGLIKPEYRF